MIRYTALVEWLHKVIFLYNEVIALPKLEYYNVNINPKFWIKYNEKMFINRIQPHLIISMSLTSGRADHTS